MPAPARAPARPESGAFQDQTVVNGEPTSIHADGPGRLMIPCALGSPARAQRRLSSWRIRCLIWCLFAIFMPLAAAEQTTASPSSVPSAIGTPAPGHDAERDGGHATTPPPPAPVSPTTPSVAGDGNEPAEQPIVSTFLRIGFNHIIPEGLDHILFVVGLFLLAPRLKPLLIQVTAFTVAHSITLGLCMADIVHLPPRLVETTIAASIAFVAIENICYKDLKPWRWMVVFCFGLIHGLGFADTLKELGLPPGHFFPALISFNVGVEAGQLTVIAVAALLTVWFWKKTWYRTAIVIPGSAIIAGIGLFWAVQRAFGYGD